MYILQVVGWGAYLQSLEEHGLKHAVLSDGTQAQLLGRLRIKAD
jgi:hypothetical protein